MGQITSLIGARGLPQALCRDDYLVTIQPRLSWTMPAPIALEGVSDINAAMALAAIGSSRRVSANPVYIAVLHQAVVSPLGLVFNRDGNLVYESLFPWQLENFESRFSDSVRLDDGGVHPAKSFTDIGPSLEVAFAAREGGEVGYFHFINSILPRLALARRLTWSKEPDLLVDDTKSFARDVLLYLGLEKAAVTGRWVKVDRLLFPSPMTFEGDHFTRPPYSASLLKELSLHKFSRRAGRKVYLSRRDAAVRRLNNEAEVCDLLQSLGFELVAIDDMNLEGQVELFGSTSVLVSAHGAGLSNIVFMPPGSSVLEVLSPRRLWPTFRTLAARQHHFYGAVIGKDVNLAQGTTEGNEDFSCDLKDLKLALDQLTSIRASA